MAREYQERSNIVILPSVQASTCSKSQASFASASKSARPAWDHLRRFRIEVMRYARSRRTLARSVAPLQHYRHALPRLHHPLLHHQQLQTQFSKLRPVCAVIHIPKRRDIILPRLRMRKYPVSRMRIVVRLRHSHIKAPRKLLLLIQSSARSNYPNYSLRRNHKQHVHILRSHRNHLHRIGQTDFGEVSRPCRL